MDMIDIETENRLEENSRIQRERSMKKGDIRGEIRQPPVKIVAGNKCDLKEQRVITSRQGLEWARARNCGFMETSAREMVNIEETFARELTPGLIYLFINLPALTSATRIVIVRRVVEARRQSLNPLTGGPTAGRSSKHNVNQYQGAGAPLQMRSPQQQSQTTRTSPNMQNLEKSGFDDRDERAGRASWWRRWLRGGCFGR